MRRLRMMMVALTVLSVTGCVGMPTQGPVVESEAQPVAEETLGISFDPRPPQPGDTAVETVSGFLEAMKAAPIKTTVARQFLSAEAQESWRPEERILTYSDLGTPSGGSQVVVGLADVGIYDQRGAWRRQVSERQLEFGLVREGDEWRIEEVPDALVVPETWFDDWYQQVSTYYFDPTDQILVPEPVFVPRGDQEASALVSSLLTMPAGVDRQTLRTHFPEGAAPGLSVPVSAGGVAEVTLTGDPLLVDEQSASLMLAQLVWTLRQLPRVRAVQLRIGDRTFGPPGGGAETSLDFGSEYDPTGRHSTGDVFGLQDGVLVRGDITRLDATQGPLGQDALGVRSVSTNLAGTLAAAVTDDGTTLVQAPVEQRDGEVVRVATGTALQAPVWDHLGRMWVLDVNGGSARVLQVVEAEVREVSVPGVTGHRISKLLVSRDGTRLVAVRRGGREGDRVVVGRITQERTGALLRVRAVSVLPRGSEVPTRIRDIAWRSASSVSILSVISDDLAQVRTVSVAGAPGEVDTQSTTRLRGPVRSLVSTPLEGVATFALTGRSVSDLARPERNVPDLPGGLVSLTYAG